MCSMFREEYLITWKGNHNMPVEKHVKNQQPQL